MVSIGFSGGEALKARLLEIAQKVGRADQVRVGFLETATYPDGQSVAMIAAIQEFGAPAKGIPPRPFFRGMVAESSPGWGAQLGGLIKAEDYDGAVALAAMGQGIQGQLQASITAFTTPGNAPSTVARKGFDKPLIDTGTMLRAVDYEVK